MASTETSSRKRKACLPCIRAKAKCSTSGAARSDQCYRCTRLSKQCVFDVAAKKPGPGPKSRSRVKQLEQRVESLIDLIATQKSSTNGSDEAVLERAQRPVTVQVVTPDSTATSETPNNTRIPAHPRYLLEPASFKPYDPVEAGLLDEQYAAELVDEYKASFTPAYPFVVVDTDFHTLRQQQPFLFHAILTVTSYSSPPIQHVLEDQLKHQLGLIIEHSRKSLEILQGLLVYAAWYHAFYKPINQQLATLVSLCVALVQDLSLSKISRHHPGKCYVADCAVVTRSKNSRAEKRAYLGTFYHSALFSQAWRKRTTLQYTRYMSQCIEAFDESTISTDALIKPFSELLVRVNEYFSFDDIENSEISGEALLDMSSTNFLRELKRITGTVSTASLMQQNTSLSLLFCLIDMGINEVSLHSILWHTSRQKATLPPSTVRLRMLHRAMKAGTLYLKTLLESPQSILYHLGIGSWAGWFYAVVLICKLVFLTENERLGRSDLQDIPEELDNLIPQNMDQVIASTAASNYQESEESNWNALSVAREYNMQELFEQFMDKMRFTLPVGVGPWGLPRDQAGSLHSIGSIQLTMLHGFTKRLGQLALATTRKSNDASVGGLFETAPAEPTLGGVYAAGPAAMPFANFMNFDSINLDSVNLASSSSYMPQEMLGDWMWDMVMDDFSMPTL